MASRIFQKRVDEELFKKVDDIYRSLGTNVGDAFVMFLKKSEEVKGLPFELRQPTRKQVEAKITETAEREIPNKKIDLQNEKDIEGFFDESY